MRDRSNPVPTFSVTHDSDPSESLIAGFSAYGLAGLTAVDYLTDHLELAEQGHIGAEGIPSITPFEKGRPRHPTRLYSAPDVEVAVRLVETVEETYGLGIDAGPLESFAAEIRRHYEDIAEQIEAREPEDTYDRMYM